MNTNQSNNQLGSAPETIGFAPDIDWEQMANIAGQTPFYVYRRSAISKRVQLIRDELPSSVSLNYSIKANPHPAVVNHLAGQVDGMDVASHSEMLLAIASGLSPDKISFSGPGKSIRELTAAVAANVVIHVESLNELNNIINIGTSMNCIPKLAIRINPPFSIKRSGMVMGGGSQQFGIDLEQLPPIMQRLRDNAVECVGLHCYPGSQMLDANIVADTYTKTLEMMHEVELTYSLTNASFNIGGGLGVPYFSTEREVNIRAIGESLAATIERLNLSGPVIVELGRYLVASAGSYVARVVDKKVSRGKTFLIVDGGLNHHLAATGNLGQVLQRNYPITSSAVSTKLELVTLVGPLCTPLDTLANDIELPETNVGDYIAVHQSGAYGYSASPLNFLGHQPATELVIE